GIIDTNNEFYEINSKLFNDHPNLVKYEVGKLFAGLTSKIVNEHLYAQPNAQGTRDVFDQKTLYGMVECTRDLSRVNCMNCLNFLIREFLDSSYKMRGGHAICGSCYVRFEFHHYF
ncbi:unnamed protein product, partial [Prunus brigantina]